MTPRENYIEGCPANCGNCNHYNPEKKQCRRFPPVPFVTAHNSYSSMNRPEMWLHPSVEETDWCGEWELMEDE